LIKETPCSFALQVIPLGFLIFWSFRAKNTKNIASPDILALEGIIQTEATAL
jgi:hypothetical protein